MAALVPPRLFGRPPSAAGGSEIAPEPEGARTFRAGLGARLRGWKEILLRVYENIFDHHLLTLAAGVTFYSLLAIFPALAALIAIYGLFSDPRSIAAHLDTLSGVLPDGAIEVMKGQLTRIAANGAQTLGLTFATSLAISLWSANSAMKGLFDALNVTYEEKEKRGFIRINLISLSLTLAGIFFMLLAIAALVVLPVAFRYLGAPDAMNLAVRVGRWPTLFVVLTLALDFIYRFGPNRKKRSWRWITWGSMIAAILWLVASALFSWCAANFVTYNQTYGSLGAVVGFMTWLWISAIAILLGAEVDAELERRRAKSRQCEH
ncbi:YihY/virulence factor BrkB family protein [Rhodoblastus acidophilus]|uniref:YihY/virulence factor BrkB family protein n=1 Tax=Candidatus Rhodoblastus alkanivorans TaxID=2954117 RepID=A0ABS9Z2M0_9HYPH|nr:YihY/virulence factor BrkB family protein [Candidatus Rhodoblastus alkanivorans]MCI4678581.1 YihY/virulence factor BrkB family protein [Candidatus Rhodoblastus alkanivorans]MCI4681331.1 YihY/virulence factor BrkB family protein [Candidatus Rhodoblastus alkanivorans]MDI4642378.1 YihY/virulence factor BrkB family protein [Rhodoblastus acidophilus]